MKRSYSALKLPGMGWGEKLFSVMLISVSFNITEEVQFRACLRLACYPYLRKVPT